MPLILGLDPSQKTGWALYDTSANLSAMRCGVLKIEAESGGFEQNAGKLGAALVKLLMEWCDPATNKLILPDFAVIEKAPRQPYGQFKPATAKQTVKFMGDDIPAQGGEEDRGGGNGLQSTLSTNQMAAALSSVLGAYKIPFKTMTDGEWRKRAYGFGRKAGWNRVHWKRHARQLCGQMRIAVTNDDMAEACWIAFAGSSSADFKLLKRATEAA